jgi:tRNA nucleotidyltransferase (CCA-adding enzyme)
MSTSPTTPSVQPSVATILFDIPAEPTRVIELLQSNGHEAFLVGGCVRDLVMNRTPHDWDIVTSALPDQMIALAESAGIRVVYENTFGTVSFIFPDNTQDSGLREIQATPYRSESSYSDKRHPDTVSFSNNVADDIARRDFTMNALVYNPMNHELHDNTRGIPDILGKIIRTIGSPFERFAEDPLRIMRAVRFSAQLGFEIESQTAYAMKQQLDDIRSVSIERIRDEFTKMVMSPEPKKGIDVARETGLLDIILPELLEGVGCEQSRSHIYDVYTHNLNALQNSVWQEWPLHVCLARSSTILASLAVVVETKSREYGHSTVTKSSARAWSAP